MVSLSSISGTERGSRGGKIEEIEKETETKDGKSVTVYEAKIKKPDGKEFEIEVGEDGKLIKIDD